MKPRNRSAVSFFPEFIDRRDENHPAAELLLFLDRFGQGLAETEIPQALAEALADVSKHVGEFTRAGGVFPAGRPGLFDIFVRKEVKLPPAPIEQRPIENQRDRTVPDQWGRALEVKLETASSNVVGQRLVSVEIFIIGGMRQVGNQIP